MEALSAKATSISEGEMQDYTMRLQICKNALIQNQRKIWIRTRLGKGMLEKMGSAAETLIDVLKTCTDSAGIEAALIEVEAQAKEIEEESRRRDMVVT
jgi:hypothetical protein